DTFYFDAYTSGGGGSDSAVDALSNPNVSITAWDEAYTSRTNDTGLSSYTLVNFVTADVSPSNGPFAGGNVVLVTNAVPAIGDGSDITNVVLGGVGTTTITGQGANWVAFVAPPASSAGVKDVEIQSTSVGDTTLANAYTVNPAGEIGGTNFVIRWTAVGDAVVPGQIDAKGANNTIYSIDYYNNNLYAGGAFTNIGGSNSYRVARHDGTNWNSMQAGVFRVANVNYIKGGPYGIYSGGYYTNIGGSYTAGGTMINDGAANAFAVGRFDGTNWNGMGHPPAVGYTGRVGLCFSPTINGYVNFIEPYTGNTVIAGGYFTNSDYRAAGLYYIAKYDGAGWTNLQQGFRNVPLAAAYDRARDHLYVGGSFTNHNPTNTSVHMNFIARWNGTHWTNMARGLGARVTCMAVHPSSGELYVGGWLTNYNNADGQAYPANYVAKWDPVSESFTNVGSGFNNWVYSLKFDTNGTLYAGGAFTNTYITTEPDKSAPQLAVTRIARWNGTHWTNMGGGCSDTVLSLAVNTNNNDLYASGHFRIAYQDDQSSTNTWYVARYGADGIVSAGVEPSSGSVTGGFEVVITGDHLGGGDITNVTICGASAASIESQSATQVVVVAGSGAPGLGDVRVYSTSYGETTKSDAFTYLGGVMTLLGTNGASITSGEAPSLAKGTDFGLLSEGVSATNTLTVTNGGNETLTIEGWTTNGLSDFVVVSGPDSVAAGATADFVVAFHPIAPGPSTASVQIAHNAMGSPFALNLEAQSGKLDQTITFAPIAAQATNAALGLAATASSGLEVSFSVGAGPGNLADGTNLTFSGPGSVSVVASQAGDGVYNPAPDVTNIIHVYALTAYAGPYEGGNTLTITNGYFGTITNVLVGGIVATIEDVGTNWARIVVPSVGSYGMKDIVVQTSDETDTTLAQAYKVNPPVMPLIASEPFDYEVTRWDTNVPGHYDGGTGWGTNRWEVDLTPQPGHPVPKAAIFGTNDYEPYEPQMAYAWGHGGRLYRDLGATLDTSPGAKIYFSLDMYTPETADSHVSGSIGGFGVSIESQAAKPGELIIYTPQNNSWNEPKPVELTGLYGSWHRMTAEIEFFATGSVIRAWIDASQEADPHEVLASTCTTFSASRFYIAHWGDSGYALADNIIIGTNFSQVALPLAVLGTNGALITSGEEPTEAKGTRFPTLLLNYSQTNVFSITNSGAETITLTDWATNGAGAGAFTALDLPSVIAPWSVSHFSVIFHPTNAGSFSASLSFSNNSALPARSISLAGACAEVFAVPSNGPYAGDYEVSLWHGYGSVFTNVIVGAAAGVAPTEAAVDRVTFVMPTALTAGPMDITLQRDGDTDVVMTNVFTYDAAWFVVAPSNGPYAGGTAVSVTHGLNSVITNVVVRGVDVPTTGADTNGFSLVMPAVEFAGLVNFTMQRADAADFVLTNAYRYNAAVINVAPNSGRISGGDVVTVTHDLNGVVTNVLVGGVEVVPDSASTTNFVLTMPSAATAGAVNFVLQRDGVADFTINNAYTYNPAGFIGYTDPDAWMEVAGMPEARLHLAAATLSNRIYAIGGYDSDLSPRDTVYAFDGTNWTVETALPGTMTEIGATSDGTNIWLAGGGDALMRFDGVSWATVDNLTDARYQPFMVIFSNRPVVVSGGVGAVTEYDGTSLNELAQLPGGHDLLGGAGGVLGDFLIAAGGGYATAASTSAWRYDGSAWSSIAGLPAARYYMATAVWRDRVYALGGLNSDASGENTVYRFDGTNWTAGAALPYHLYAGAGTVLHGALYHVGGMSVELGVMTNVLKYVPGEEYSGVAPAFGNLAGGYPVTIRGENFGNGSDVTNVMICGVAAQGILSQSATQIVVLAGASPVMTNGDVVVYSTSYGETVRSNVFTYIYLSSWHGPYVGGNTVTLTNIVAIGDNDITNVLVGGIAATVDGQGADWVRFVLGPATNAGRSDIVVQSTSLGETVFAGSYTYNTPGVIGWRDPDRAWEQTVPLSYRVTRTAMVNYSNALYVIGGRLNFMNGTTYTNVCRFDGTNWAFVAGLPAGAMNIGAAVWDGAIYAAGNNATTVYRYDGTAWTTVTPLPAARMNPVLTVFSNQLHVVGGAFGAAVYIYDGTNWSEKAATPVAANMESVPTGVLGDFLYVGSGTYFGETNAWRFNGTDWTATVGLPKALPRTASVVADERLYAIGGMYETAVASSDTLFFNGTNWQSSSSLPYTLFLGAAAEMDRALYAIGGANSGRSNVLRMALGDTHFGVSPSNGVLNGGFEVVIGGLHLGDGNDVTNVTLCGVSVSSIQSQTATQIVVVAGASGSVGIGDVHVYSTSYGDTVKSNAFEYLKGNQSITFAPLGVQAVSDTVGLSATASSGLPVTFATNGGPAIITGGTNLTFTGLGSVSIVASQAGDGTYHPAPDVTNFVRVYALSAYAGPYVGGNSITITNGILGDGADITNVTVGGVAATITGQGETWVTITVPEVGSAGVKDIVIQSASQGNTTLANAYTVNPAGSIEVPTIMMEYLISFTGTNGTFIDYHMNDLYVTNYTPFAPAGTVYTYLSATNTEYVELAATNRGDLVKNDVWMRLDGFIDSYNGGWNDMAGGLWWLSTNVGQWFVFREEFGDSYVTITNLPGTNYHVEVINAYPNIITLRYNQQLHPGIWQPGEPRDIGNWGTNIAVWQQPRGGGNWFSPTNTFYWRDRYIVYSNTVPQDRAMTLVLWDTNGQPCNVLNAMRIRGEEPLGVPIDPPRGSWTGGYPVVINGFNLGDGSDITNVTLCGIPAMIVGQTNTSVSVNAGAYSASLLGDVRVYSVSFGETVMSNAFTYLASDMGALGTNGASFADGEAASLTKGNAFYATPFGAARTNTFSLTNSGNDVLSIDPSDLSDPSDFSISGVPATVDIGAVSNFSVTYT
ncbi:MAG: choice-of-anchor D domain-containing protein, partial [Spartobacteria bacterium]|nr:choice-of-anchor D domain-containing protein [Spartobacteria bacterium]